LFWFHFSEAGTIVFFRKSHFGIQSLECTTGVAAPDDLAVVVASDCTLDLLDILAEARVTSLPPLKTDGSRLRWSLETSS
jgi:hypothetical protein